MSIQDMSKPPARDLPGGAGSGKGYAPGRFALRDAWFPVAHAASLRRRPLARAIHGRPVYLSRADGVIVAAEESAVDRRRGRHQPSQFTGGTGRYPVIERYGFVWVWFGDPGAASPDLVPHLPHVPVEGLPRHMLGNVVFDCAYELVCDNLLDLTHADMLHSWQQRVAGAEIVVTSTSETVTMVRVERDRPVAPSLQRSVGADRQDMRMVSLVHVRSGVCLLYGAYEPGSVSRMVHPAIPESATRTRIPVAFNLGPRWTHHHLSPVLAGHLVGRQDNWALRPQGRNYRLHADHVDVNCSADVASLRYRKVYMDLVGRQQRGDYSYLPDGDPSRDVTEELEGAVNGD